jgi:GT2 family glycosyltransferase
MAAVRRTVLYTTVSPDELFRVLIKGGSGHIHLNGLVIKRSILDKTGYMSDEIADTLHEDTDFILRLAAVGKLMPGRLNEPVAMRRVHGENRVSALRPAASVYRDHMRQRVETYRWCKKKGLREQRRLAFWRMMLECVREKPYHPGFTKILPKAALKTLRLLAWPFEVPDVVFEGYYWMEVLRSFWGIILNPNVSNESL